LGFTEKERKIGGLSIHEKRNPLFARSHRAIRLLDIKAFKEFSIKSYKVRERKNLFWNNNSCNVLGKPV